MITEDPVDRWEHLENYLAGRLNDDDDRQLQEKLKTDPNLASELESVQRAQTILKDVFIEQQMRATIRQIQREQTAPLRLVRHRALWRRAVVWVAVASLVIVSYLTLAPVSLPAAGYDVMALRHVDTTKLPLQQRVAFENFFEGQARMVEGDYAQAVHHFESVLTVEDIRPYFREAAEWHLAVSYLQSRQINRASQLYRRLQQCEKCVYEVGWLNRRKMEWKLFINRLWL